MSLLYHYTSPAALCGILQNLELWATEYRFLNDYNEFAYGVEVFHDALHRHKASRGQGITAKAFDRVDALTEFFLKPKDPRRGHKVFIISLTSEPDLLSQWRGYNGGAGFCLGMESEWLRVLGDHQEFNLKRVLYKPADQQAEMDNLFAILSKAVGGVTLSDSDLLATTNEWWALAVTTVARLKDASFAEERESRMIRFTSDWPGDLCFRQSAVGIVPYIKFVLGHTEGAFKTENNNLGFSEIIVGPALSERQRMAVNAVLASKNMRFNVRKSDIPYVAV